MKKLILSLALKLLIRLTSCLKDLKINIKNTSILKISMFGLKLNNTDTYLSINKKSRVLLPIKALIPKIKVCDMKLDNTSKKQPKTIFNKKEYGIEELVHTKIVDPNTILLKNLKHLDFIDLLENGLNRKQAQNTVLIQQLNTIRRQVQLNTLSHLHVANNYKKKPNRNMELQNLLKALADKIEQLKDKIETEEATKNAFVMPFINILGYDIFNPTEVIPEFTDDLGLKKGEKVDYAIFQNQAPILIIECKNWNQNLKIHNSQLFRYFHVTKTRFALLTNGINYRFYTDLEETNKMDEKPFLEFDITKLKDNTIKEIEKFHKSKFDVSQIVDNASNLKYTKEVKSIIEQELESPSNDLVKLFANKANSGRLTSKVLEEFTEIVNKAFSQIISEKVNDRLNSALNKEKEKQQAG